MAYSIQQEVSDGTLALLDVSISYLDREEIAVFYDGALYPTGWTWVGDTDRKIAFDPVIPLGVEISLVRTTELGELRHRFSAGAAFTTQSMDEALEQVLHIAQEAAEQLQGTDFYNDVDVHGYLIKNVGDGVASGDAANVGQMTAHDAIIVGYKDETLGYRNEAEGFRDDAALSAAAAEGVVTTHVAQADPHTQYVLESAIGTTVQAYDAATAKTDVAQNFTAPQRSAALTDNDGVFDLAAKMNFTCTPTGPITLTFNNQADGQDGRILLDNTAGAAVSANANTLISLAALARISVAGKYRITYSSDGTKAWCVASENLTS